MIESTSSSNWTWIFYWSLDHNHNDLKLFLHLYYKLNLDSPAFYLRFHAGSPTKKDVFFLWKSHSFLRNFSKKIKRSRIDCSIYICLFVIVWSIWCATFLRHFFFKFAQLSQVFLKFNQKPIQIMCNKGKIYTCILQSRPINHFFVRKRAKLFWMVYDCSIDV